MMHRQTNIKLFYELYVTNFFKIFVEYWPEDVPNDRN